MLTRKGQAIGDAACSRRWSVEEKLWIARESLAPDETITAVANRYGVPRNRLSAWRWRGAG